jgi:hypothetical protein
MSSTGKSRWWRTAFKATVFLVAALLTLVVLAAAVLSFLGRREWAAVKRELVAKGERLSLAEFQLPPLPDAQNFFGDPMWQELEDLTDVEVEEEGVRLKTKQIRLPEGQRQLDALSRPLTPEERQALVEEFPGRPIPENARVTNLIRKAFKPEKALSAEERRQNAAFVLAVLRPIDPLLQRLEELARRPGARFPLGTPAENVAVSIGRTNYFLRYAQILQARMWAELELGQNEAAFRDALTLLRLPETLGDSPLYIYVLIRIALEELALKSVCDGLYARVWSDRELAELERALARMNLPAALAQGLRGERAFGNQMLEQVHEPNGNLSPVQQAWSTPSARVFLAIFEAGDTAARNRHFQELIEGLDRAPEQGLSGKTLAWCRENLENLKKSAWQRLRYPMTSQIMPDLVNPIRNAAELQDVATQARIVCALERYRLKNGTYPPDLGDLVPELLPAIPVDVATLQTPRYVREGEGFRLWTPGWDGEDGGGKGNDVLWGKTLKSP